MAVYAQYAIGVIALISTVIAVIQTNTTMAVMREELGGEGVEGLSAEQLDAALGFGTAISYAVAFVSLLFALAVSLLGVFNAKGKNGARVTTWVLAGLGLLCSVCGSIGGAFNSVTGGTTGTTGGSDALTEATERAMAELPGWYYPATLAFAIINLLLYLAIIILLAVPASNDYFRKPKSDVDVMLPPQAYMDAPPPPSREPKTDGGDTPNDGTPPKP